MNDDFEIDYDLALERVSDSLTLHQKDILSAMYAAPEGVAAGLLAPLLGLSHHAPLNSAMASLGKALTMAVGAEPPRRGDGSERWWHVVATGENGEEGRFYWILRPALRAAITKQTLFVPDSTIFPDAIGYAEPPLVEGAAVRVTVNGYERNPIARRRCIAHYSPVCVVCRFDFGAFYGPIADGAIHVHHVVPLATAGGADYEIDPVRDLRPVCPNCHLAIHRREPPLSIEEARELVMRYGNRPTSSCSGP